MITGVAGLFAKANNPAGKYNQAAKNEADLLNQQQNKCYVRNMPSSNREKYGK